MTRLRLRGTLGLDVVVLGDLVGVGLQDTALCVVLLISLLPSCVVRDPVVHLGLQLLFYCCKSFVFPMPHLSRVRRTRSVPAASVRREETQFCCSKRVC